MSRLPCEGSYQLFDFLNSFKLIYVTIAKYELKLFLGGQHDFVLLINIIINDEQ